MDAKGVVVMPGEGAVSNMSPGRSAALELLNTETAESLMAFEETAPTGTDTTFHVHDDSDELIYDLSGDTPGGAGRMFEEARRLKRPFASMDDREIAEFFKRFGWETVGPPPS